MDVHPSGEPRRETDRTSYDAPPPPAPPRPDAPPPPPSPEEQARSRRRRGIGLVIGAIVVIALIVGGVLYWLDARQYETTDDAFIDGHTTQMAPQISGRVTALLIDDNQHVTAGQKLIEIDPRDYQVKLDQARAQLGSAQAQLHQAQAQLAVQQASLDQALANVRVSDADLLQAKQDYSKYTSIDPKAITRQQLDNANATVRSATARLDANKQAAEGARAQIDAQRAQIGASEAQVREMEANVANAELQLSYTTLVAPAAGRVTKRSVEVGNYVSPGQSVLAIVQDNLWVTANFKETQLTHMVAGQKVDVTVDAFPDVTFAAHVDSFQSGTGSVFSSLPAENATGNYVKVIQRLPVKIVFDDRRSADYRLAPGMSVGPRVKVR